MILPLLRWFLHCTFFMSIVFNHVEYIAAKLPLMEDFSIMAPKVSQQTQCVFDKDLYEIGEKWKPNIEPFGVQYCILCECIAVQRKKESTIRVMAKVQCRNFKNDCPKPTCDNPVLLPERCCKSCPGDKNNLEEIIASQKMEEALLMKNFRKKFLAVLVGTSDRSNDSGSKSKAFLHINKQRLAFIIEVKSHKKVTYVRFQDLDDTIIEEYVVSGNKSKIHNDHYLIYGSWAKVPKPYRSMIRKGHLKMSISFSKDINVKSSLAGLIQKHTSLMQANLSEHESSYFDLMDSGFGKSEIFQTMLNTTSFVSYEDRNSLDRKALMDQSSSSSSSSASMNSIDSQLKCYYEAQIYEEGAQWKNQNDDCEMCFCQRGRVKCESEICLKLRCREQVRIDGQCCPVCKSKLSSLSSHRNESCFFEGDKKYHLIGSRWHPYIPPFGFDRCTVCMCTENARIKCKRNECPPLPCAETDAYRENPMDCCKKCRAPTRSMMGNYQDSMNNDQANNDDSVQQALATGSCHFRGKIYSNGDEWHPTVDPYGEINCIKCGCKDGIHKCQRLKCKPTPPNCPKIIKKGECCPQCVSVSQNPSPSSDNNEDFYSAAAGTRRVSTRTRF